MPDINVDLNYFEHPKTVRLVNLLGHGADVLPLKLWSHCGKFHTKTGIIGRKSVAELESIVEWWGDPGMAVRGLQRVGFLGKNRDGFYAHDWKKHQGHIHALSQRNKKAAVNRWRKLGKTAVDKSPVEEKSKVPLVQDGMPQLSVTGCAGPSVQQQRTGVKSNTNLTALIASVPKLSREEALRQTKLLAIPMPFGRYEGVLLSDLPVEYCEWLQGNAAEHAKLGRDLREGLALRIALKAEECGYRAAMGER